MKARTPLYPRSREERDALVLSCQGLVRKIAKRYRPPYPLGYEDIIGFGQVGLVKAAERYNPDRAAFTTYSAKWIRRYILLGIGDADQFGVCHVVRWMAHAAAKKEQAGEPVRLTRGVRAARKAMKLRLRDWPSQLVREADQRTSADHEEDREWIEAAMACLTECERMVVRWHFGLDGTALTLPEIGARLHVTGERARQIKRQAMARLRARWEAA